MPFIQIGLVDKTERLDRGILQAAAAAFNIQVMQDLPKFWPVQATVVFFA